jgi:nucleotide-binding universal stress UspA family protein
VIAVLSGDQGGPVVVAVGAASNGQAVEWAAAEAAARGSELRVVHAERLQWTVDPSGLVPVVDVLSHRLAAEDILRVAVERARAVAPGLEIAGESMVGATVPSLVSQGRRARLLVLGSGSGQLATGVRRLWAPSVWAGVARRALCPVAIVGPLRSSPPPGVPPRVVVGVNGSGACAAVLGVAFAAAAQRGLPMTVIHAWSPDVPADLEAVCGPYHVAEERVGLTVQRAIEPWSGRFPDVPVRTQLTHADPASALIRESEGAALVVVGCRAHGRARPALLGPVGRRVARQARCPVVVVRAAERRSARGRRDQGAELGRPTTVRIADPTGTEAIRRRGPSWE